MSVDLGAEMRRPITLAELISRASQFEAQLLGVQPLPPVSVISSVGYVQGRVVSEGLPVDAETLSKTWIGPGGGSVVASGLCRDRQQVRRALRCLRVAAA